MPTFDVYRAGHLAAKDLEAVDADAAAWSVARQRLGESPVSQPTLRRRSPSVYAFERGGRRMVLTVKLSPVQGWVAEALRNTVRQARADDVWRIFDDATPGDHLVADVYGAGRAALVLAAPKMLEALEAIVKATDNCGRGCGVDGDLLVAAQAAVAAAKRGSP